MTKYLTLNIPFELVDALRTIADKQDIPTTWSKLAKDSLWSYVAMHRARGNLDE